MIIGIFYSSKLFSLSGIVGRENFLRTFITCTASATEFFVRQEGNSWKESH